jgi:hypothetical protein
LPGSIQQLAVAGDEDVALGPAQAPDHGGGQLLGVGGLQRKAIDEALGPLAQRLTRGYFPPDSPEIL